MHRVEQGTFKHEGFTLAYEVHGPDDGPPVVLVHGILLDAAVNRDVAAPMAGAGFRVILLDLLGHGRSDRAEAAELRNDFFADQVVGCLDHLGIGSAVVGGVSLGAIVALHVAVRAPRRVRALLLEMPVMEESAPLATVLLSPLLFATSTFAWLYRPFARLLHRLPRPRKAVFEGVLNAASQDPEAIRAILHGVLVGPVVPARRQRRAIQAPALVVGHGGDWLHSLEDARALAEDLPNGRLITAKSVLELRLRPERLMPEILGFLREVAGDPAVKPEVAPAAAAGTPTLQQRFEAAVARVSGDTPGAAKPSNEMKLRMYALYRQARDGDVQGKRPGMMDVVGRLKYDAWAGLKGMASDEAMRRYAEEVESFGAKAAEA